MSADTALMPIPGPADPLPVPRAAVPRADGKIELIGLPREKIRAVLEGAGLEPKQAKLRAKQIWHWIYNRGVGDFAAMTDIAKAQQPWFATRFVVTRPQVVEAQVSTDGTRKWLLRTHDGHDFEMVFIPDADRGTLCVSSQVGCTLNCTFCHTGTMKLVRNLDPAEIVGQVMLARDALGELLMTPACEANPGMAALKKSDADKFKAICTGVRTDGAYVETGENDNLIVQKLEANPGSVGIFGYSYLEENANRLKGLQISAVSPTYATISSFQYPGARPLYIYIKNAHASAIPAVRAYALEFTKESAFGPKGYLLAGGMVSSPNAVRARAQQAARMLSPLDLGSLK